MTWADVLAICFSGDGDVYGDGAEWKMNAKSKKPNRSKRSPADNAWKQGSLQSKPSFWGLSNPNSSSHLTKDLLVSLGSSNICAFTLNELQSITNNFSRSYLLGEWGFGPVYKGFVDEKLRHGVLKPQPVAVKLLDLEGLQGHREWQAEVTYLGQLKYPHVVKLIGYCCEEEQRILVYEFMARGSLENHLFKRFSASLPWSSRLKIAVGAAKGLAFLHGQDKPIIYRDFKASNILLDSDFTAKLSDFGLAKDGPEGEETHVSTRVMGTHGYAAPEYVMKGHLTAKSDVYSFGVVLLELLTGLRAVDKKRPVRKQNLVEWARPRLLIHESRKLNHIMDPNLEGQYSIKGAQKAAALAYRCLAHHPKNRPVMSSVVEILEPLQQLKDNMITHFVYSVSTAENGKSGDRKQQGKKPTAAKEINNIHGHSHDHRKRNEGRRAGHRNRSPVSVMSSTQSWSSNSDGSSCRNSPSPRHDKGGGEEPI